MKNKKGFKVVFDFLESNKNKTIDVSFYIGGKEPISVLNGKLNQVITDQNDESINFLTLYFDDHFLEVSDNELNFEIGEQFTNGIPSGHCVLLSFKNNDNVYILIDFR